MSTVSSASDANARIFALINQLMNVVEAGMLQQQEVALDLVKLAHTQGQDAVSAARSTSLLDRVV